MERQDLTLLLASGLAAAPEERYPLDRIRLQKAVFLLTQRGSPSWGNLYFYRPYNWGPYSSQLTADVDWLVASKLLEIEQIPWVRHGRYRTTALGEAKAIAVWAVLDAREQSFIRTVRAYVTSRSFTELLREVYAAYPQYATASQFTG